MSGTPLDFLPVPPHDFHVLLMLADGPRHAYGLATAMELPEGGVRLELGSLYRVLARLTSTGLIAEDAGAGSDGGHEARRRYYRLTPLGRRVAEAETARLQAVVRLARQRKLAPGKAGS